jgi:hypothetical protein
MKQGLMLRLTRLEQAAVENVVDEAREKQEMEERLERLLGSFRRGNPVRPPDEIAVIDAFNSWWDTKFPPAPRPKRRLKGREKERREMEEERVKLQHLDYQWKSSKLKYLRSPMSWYRNAAEREFFTLWSEMLPDRPFEETAYDVYSDQIVRIEARIYMEIEQKVVPNKKRRYFWNKKTGRVRIVGMKGGKFYRTPEPDPFDDESP